MMSECFYKNLFTFPGWIFIIDPTNLYDPTIFWPLIPHSLPTLPRLSSYRYIPPDSRTGPGGRDHQMKVREFCVVGKCGDNWGWLVKWRTGPDLDRPDSDSICQIQFGSSVTFLKLYHFGFCPWPLVCTNGKNQQENKRLWLSNFKLSKH